MNYKKYIGVAFLSLSVVGCSNFLDEIPDQRTLIDTPEKAQDLLVFAYPLANSYVMMEQMSDNVGDSGRTQNTSRQGKEFYSWEDETGESFDSPAEFWESSYSAIAHANQAVKSIESMNAPKARKDLVLGEALLARAYNHLMLSIIFCEAYDPTTASSVLGIPYVYEVENVLIKEYKRGTLAEFYEKLEKDIEDGMKLVGSTSKQPKFHFDQDAGRALATRFYALKGDWEKVMYYTNNLGDYPVGKLRTYSDLLVLADDKQAQTFGGASTPANLLIGGVRSILSRKVKTDRFGGIRAVLLPTISAAFNPYDKGYVHSPTGYTGYDIFAYKRFYEYFVYSNQSTGSGQPYVNVPLLTTDEMYLFRIEAYLMNKEYDKATKMMGYFAKFRTTGYLATNNESTVKTQTLLTKAGNADDYQPFYTLDTDQRKLVKFLAEMRRTEFYHLGNRWIDIKRFNLPVTHDIVGETTLKLEAKDKRKAVQLPKSALSANLTANPR